MSTPESPQEPVAAASQLAAAPAAAVNGPAKPAVAAVKPPPLPGNLKELLTTAGITSVAVIDDIFDAPTIAELGQAEVDGFAQNLADQGAYHGEAKTVGLQGDSGKMEDKELGLLWNYCLAKRDEPLAKLANTTLFKDRVSRHAVVTNLCSTLSAVDTVKVATAGAEEKLADGNVQLVFLDYVLQPHNHGGTAVAKIKEIYATAARPPLIILISDFPKVDPIKRLAICREVGTLKGYFGFIAKHDLGDETMLCLKMAELGIGTSHSGHEEIRNFAVALADAISTSAEHLRNFIHGLELQDYVHLESKRLDAAGETLGDYIEWLIESMLGHILSEKETLKEKRSKVDGLSYTRLMPAFGPPSNNLTKAFFLAQTEPRIETDSALRMGDVFLDGGRKRARLVISPACDLMRNPPANRGVFYVEGVIDDAHTHPSSVEPEATECFVFEEKPLRITWDIDEGVRCIEYSKFLPQMQADGYHRTARLRPIFTVAIQRLFADRLCRVGLPVAPPVGSKAKVRLFVNLPGNNFALLGEVLEDAGEVIREGTRFEGRLTTDGVAQVRKLLGTHLNHPDVHKGEPYAAVFDGNKDWIANMLNRHKFWLRIVCEFSPGNSGAPSPKGEADFVIGIHPGEKKKPILGPLTICISRD